jgi:hypothetical protein
VLYHILAGLGLSQASFLMGGEHMARKTLILAALIALGLGGAFVVSTVSAVTVQASSTGE